MTLKTPDTKIKGQLVVGETLVGPVGFGVGITRLIGTGYFAGPLMVGDTKPFVSPPGVPLASAMFTKRSSLDGLVGAGGGFLIIPALVVFLKLNMKIAVGTSLFIIFLKSTIGIIGDIQVGIKFDYNLIFLVILFTSVGVLLGSKLNKIIGSEVLKKTFGIIVLIIAIIIILIELS